MHRLAAVCRPNCWRCFRKKRKTVLFITHSVEEAAFLSDRVVVITSRPARMRDVVDIAFPYPRDERLKAQSDFLELRERLRQEVMQEYMMQERGEEE